MRTLEEYMALPYRMEILPDRYEGGFVVRFPDLPGCVTTGETIEEAYAMSQDAKRAWLSASLEDGYPIPEPGPVYTPEEEFDIHIPHRMRDAIARASERDGVSVKQFCMDALTRAVSV